MIAGPGVVATAGLVLAVLGLVPGLGLLLLLWKDPRAPLLLMGAAVAVSAALFLIRRPLLTLYAALFLLLLPMGLRVEPLHTLATNGTLLLALTGWILRRDADGGSRWSPTGLVFLAFLAWAALSLVWAPNAVEGRRELIAWTIGFLLLFLLVNRTRSLEALDGLMRMLALYGWMIVAAALYTVFLTGYSPGHRLRVLDINENMLGILLILTLPGVIWPVLRAAGGWTLRRGVLMALSVVYVLCALAFTALSGSRGSTVSLVLILLAFLFARATRPWGLIGLVLVGGLMLVAPFLLGLLIQRFMEEDGGELGGRGDLWEASAHLIGERPWTGAGIGNGPLVLHDYIAALSSGHNARIDLPSHQPFLEVGIDTGLPGIVLYGALLATALWSFARSHAAWTRLGAPAGYHVVVAGITVGYLLSWFKAGGIKNHPSFFLVLALLLIPAHLARAAAFRRALTASRLAFRGADHA